MGKKYYLFELQRHGHCSDERVLVFVACSERKQDMKDEAKNNNRLFSPVILEVDEL